MAIPAPPLPGPPARDPVLGPLLDAFTACVCAELAVIGRPVCACCTVWGDSIPPADFCDCDCSGGHGQAWVRLVDMDPQTSAKRAAGARCRTFGWTARIEAGVYRCVTAGGPNGAPPSCEQRAHDAGGLLADLAALRTAAACCDALNGLSQEMVTAEPTSVRGGCSGGLVQFRVDLDAAARRPVTPIR